MSMSDYINKTDAAYDDPFDISEITSAYECVKGDPFDISELSAAIESKIGNFVRKISPESFENFGMTGDKAKKMYNTLVTYMCKKGWLAYVEDNEETNRVILHNWKETADHLIAQGYFDGDNITEIGHRYLRQLYKTLQKKASDGGWTIDELIVKAKEDSKAKATLAEMVKYIAAMLGVTGLFAALPQVTVIACFIHLLTMMVLGDVGCNSMERVKGYYEGNLMQRDTAAYESVATESMATVLDKDAQKETEKEDNKKENFIDLKSLYKVEINPDAIDKYKGEFRQLYRVNKNVRNLCGYMYFMNSTGKKGDLVAFFSVKNQSGKNWIDTLEVSPEYRGNRLSHQLLDVASKEFDATDVIIDSDNKFAIRIFNKYGFMPYTEKDGKTYMSTDSSTVKGSNYKPAKESTEGIATESVFKKPSKEEYTRMVIERFQKSLSSPEKKVNYEKLLTQNMSVFKSTITELKRLEFRHDRSIISEKDYLKEKKTATALLKRLASQVGVNIQVFAKTNAEVPDIEGYQNAYEALKEIKKSL